MPFSNISSETVSMKMLTRVPWKSSYDMVFSQTQTITKQSPVVHTQTTTTHQSSSRPSKTTEHSIQSSPISYDKADWHAHIFNLFVGWLLNVPATGECISGTDLLRQFYVLPHWDRRCRSNVLPHPVTVYWHRANQSQCLPYNARRLAG